MQASLIKFNAKCCFDVVSWRLGEYPVRYKRQEGVEPTTFGVLVRVLYPWTLLGDRFESLSLELSKNSDFSQFAQDSIQNHIVS